MAINYYNLKNKGLSNKGVIVGLCVVIKELQTLGLFMDVLENAGIRISR